jgi:uncharacterized membrane protein YphA (DoxX/SURF4 family)
MAATTADPTAPSVPSAGSGRAHALAVARIAFGLVWLVDAVFKWLPGFRDPATISAELGKHAKAVNVPVLHQWMMLWYSIGTANPTVFADVVAVIETLIAFGLILGLFSRAVLLGSAIFSVGIWSTAEGLGLPLRHGQTDIGPSIGYVFASLALYFAAAGTVWSLDARLRRDRAVTLG